MPSSPTTSVRPLLRITCPLRAGATTARPMYGVGPAAQRQLGAQPTGRERHRSDAVGRRPFPPSQP